MEPYVLCLPSMSIKDFLTELMKVDQKSTLDIILRHLDATQRNVSYTRVYDEFTRCSSRGINLATSISFPLDYNQMIQTG